MIHVENCPFSDVSLPDLSLFSCFLSRVVSLCMFVLLGIVFFQISPFQNGLFHNCPFSHFRGLVSVVRFFMLYYSTFDSISYFISQSAFILYYGKLYIYIYMFIYTYVNRFFNLYIYIYIFDIYEHLDEHLYNTP